VKHFAKKRETLTAVQWTGEMTPEMKTFLEVNAHSFGVVDGRLHFANSRGPGRIVDMGDWVVLTPEGLIPFGDQDLSALYDEVDEAGRSLPPSEKEHEAAGHAFVQALDALLVGSLGLTREFYPKIFLERDRLIRLLRGLLEDHSWEAARRERARIVSRITKEIL